MSDARNQENSLLAIAKSILVIPLVIAIVVGLARGLVHLAHGAQIKSGKPEPSPVVKSDDGTITLHEPFTEVRGETSYWQGHASPRPSEWKRMPTDLSWHIPLETPGRYVIKLEFSCDPAEAGSQIRIEMAGATFEPTILSTGGPNKFELLRAGEVNIPAAGWYDLRISPVNIVRNSIMTLRRIRLIPAK
jgi:hypothetical protein